MSSSIPLWVSGSEDSSSELLFMRQNPESQTLRNPGSLTFRIACIYFFISGTKRYLTDMYRRVVTQTPHQKIMISGTYGAIDS